MMTISDGGLKQIIGGQQSNRPHQETSGTRQAAARSSGASLGG